MEFQFHFLFGLTICFYGLWHELWHCHHQTSQHIKSQLKQSVINLSITMKIIVHYLNYLIYVDAMIRAIILSNHVDTLSLKFTTCGLIFYHYSTPLNRCENEL